MHVYTTRDACFEMGEVDVSHINISIIHYPYHSVESPSMVDPQWDIWY